MSRRIRAIVTTAAATALLCACEVGPSGVEDLRVGSVTVILSGTVTNALDGSPVAGATVQDVGESAIGLFGFGVYVESAVTDSSGRYTLEARCSRSCPDLDFVAHLERFERGLAPQMRTLRSFGPSDSVAIATLDFTLNPTRPITVSIRGRVTTGDTTRPAPGATVTVMESFWPFQVDSTTADSLGVYRLASAEHCALDQGACMFGPLRVVAQSGSRAQMLDLGTVDVLGDTLDLIANLMVR